MTLTENLLTLFRLDKQTRGLRSRLDSAQRYLAAQNRQLDLFDEERRELETRKRHLQAKIGNDETECRQLDERIEKLRNDLNSASTTKQYAAVLTELDTVKHARGELEEKTLEEMEQIEELEQQIIKLEGDRAERDTIRGHAEQDLQSRRGEVGERLLELEGERDQAAAVIPGKERAIFDTLADDYDGEAMASIEEINRRHREYACSECNMSVPFDAVAELLGPTASLVRCPACGRILYLEDEVRDPLVKK